MFSIKTEHSQRYCLLGQDELDCSNIAILGHLGFSTRCHRPRRIQNKMGHSIFGRLIHHG
jgi:hypothetical protein